VSTCAICGIDFPARHSYGLCPTCLTRDTARELDRVETALHKAHKSGLTATLSLREWLATLSDFAGLCGWCQEYTYSSIEMVYPSKGITYDNVVPICRACRTHRQGDFYRAELRVMQYLKSDRTPHDTTQNEEETM
jgi:hypothetical protein